MKSGSVAGSGVRSANPVILVLEINDRGENLADHTNASFWTVDPRMTLATSPFSAGSSPHFGTVSMRVRSLIATCSLLQLSSVYFSKMVMPFM